MTRKKTILIGLLFMFSAHVRADLEAEKEKQAFIIHELEALMPLIQEAEALADKESRIQFRYDWLRVDIERIKSAIQEHITAPRTQPRSFPPLKGDYRR